MTVFSKILRELLIENKMTQQELADKLSVTQSCISGYLNRNREPSFEIACKMADILNCSVDYLLDRTDESGLIKIKYSGYVPTDEDLDLLYLFNKLDSKQKKSVLNIIQTFLEK